MDVSNKLKFNELFDAYGLMLTHKQQEILRQFLQEDLGLTEIAQNLNVSRQAVRDALVSTQRILEDFEQKIGFVAFKKSLGKL